MEKINIAELLKECPLGMELDCTNYDGVVKFDGFNNNHPYSIRIVVAHDGVLTAYNLTKYGQTSISSYNKCIIFPKGKTTWKGFIPPGKFKDGDILFVKSIYNWIIIYKESKNEEDLYKYVATPNHPNHTYMVYDNNPLCYKEDISEIRLATEEEKDKLFNTIKENGYKWNAETKTLEKLGDMVDKGNISDGYHTFNELYEYRLLYNASMFNELAKQGLYDVHKSKRHSDGAIPFGDKNWFIVQAELPTGQISNHYEMKDWELFNIPEKEKANPYDGHTPQDVANRLRMFLTQNMEFVTFKMAKKLKEKGFDKFCENGYFLKSGIEYSEPNDNNVLVSSIGERIFNTECCWFEEEIEYGRDIIYAPTISQVLKWLREEKEIAINIEFIPHVWQYKIIDMSFEGRFEPCGKIFYEKYEQTALAGIEYVLDNLI